MLADERQEFMSVGSDVTTVVAFPYQDVEWFDDDQVLLVDGWRRQIRVGSYIEKWCDAIQPIFVKVVGEIFEQEDVC